MFQEIINKTKPKLEYFTEKEYEAIYYQWLNKETNNSLYNELELRGTSQQLESINKYINWKYYKDHPIYIREDDSGNHVNIMKEIGYENYINCSTFWVCLRRNAGKTTDGFIYWMIKRWELYKERGAYIRQRDMDLKAFIKEMKKEFFLTLKPMGYIFDKGAILEIETGEVVISFRNLTSQVNSSSSLAHTNILYDEPIPIAWIPPRNEKQLLMQMIMSLARDRLPVSRLLLISNANTLQTPLLDGLFLDYESFNKKQKQIIVNEFGSKIFVWLGFNVKPNRINSNYFGTSAGAFMDSEQHEFLENGKFAFDNHIYQWSFTSVIITHYHAIYVYGDFKFVEVTGIHKRTKEKKKLFIDYKQLEKKIMSMVSESCPLYVFLNCDVVRNAGCYLLAEPKQKIVQWFRGIRQDAYRFTSYMIPQAIELLFQTVAYGMELK